MEIVENLIKISENIPENVSLIAVSKTKSKNLIELAYNHGQRDFGENKVQELVEKYNSLQKDINWHMIGHLQRNKVKQIAPFVYLIHSVDSYRLLIEINKQGFKNGRIINVLVQIDISKDNTKFGFTYAEFDELIKLNKLKDLKNINLKGMMGMASFSSDLSIIEREFNQLNDFYNKHKTNLNLNILSMGMSGDYKIAIKCNSNMIRLGSTIFGTRIK
ncbi:YggS family pyridoxal phosphate-dependent enzyme [Flavobacteriaceae bacterium]|jgi:pyridoxal phosphate enzyme (YggS family)|nr:YggS family pyridoxal phosphate-dependent enzyme [Flavobacteriaceae bacterium]MBT4231525.1 YggS family pyridoxal phosphate-dependent enzyme [Flavobacteriaceae bacterium]MBT5392570.1 YggS family pyridoxal phosphate-dependent enzyme [Flavobacteriaceae bacterium]MBT7574960.1 YggS family pyridoxal phosphate-dependent enzyme [Flavobacteriaceae bacterium]MBT7984686.1 YggS family pyridoxal phosphate-dependent enzyme [Flavobacteriaceae bacterium]